MKDFNLEAIGKKMPYQAPDEKFFEDFTEEILAKVAEKKVRRFSLVRTLAPICGVAAAIAVIVSVTFNLDKGAKWDSGYLISENLDESIDAFLSSISDEELSYIITEGAYQDDFYSNLPNN